MSDAAHPDRPADGGPTPVSAGDDGDRIGPIRRWWWSWTDGWPAGVPMRPALRRHVRQELARRNVAEDLVARVTRAGLSSIGRSALWGGVIGAAPAAAHAAIIATGPGPTVIGLAIIAMLLLQGVAITRLVRVIRGPRLRAGLRREGIDCCLRCGHLMGVGGPADTCPECGFDHAEFPLRWQPPSDDVDGASPR